jgi:hypothetical protein
VTRRPYRAIACKGGRKKLAPPDLVGGVLSDTTNADRARPLFTYAPRGGMRLANSGEILRAPHNVIRAGCVRIALRSTTAVRDVAGDEVLSFVEQGLRQVAKAPRENPTDPRLSIRPPAVRRVDDAAPNHPAALIPRRPDDAMQALTHQSRHACYSRRRARPT